MPQAKIYGIREHLAPIRAALSDAVNEAIHVGLVFPRERRLQRFFPMDREDFIYPAHERSERYTIIKIETFEGRSKEVLKTLVLTPDDVMGGRAITGSVLVFDDDDYYMGGVLAETLRLRGHAVTPSPLVSAWTVNTLEQEKIQRRVFAAGIEVVANANLAAMRAGEVDLACVFTGRQHTGRADNVLLVTARTSDAALCDELMGQGADALKSLVRVGDCMAPGTIAYAVFTGRRAAEALDEPASDRLAFRTEPVATERPLRPAAPWLLAAE